MSRSKSQDLWLEINEELQWHLRNRGDLQIEDRTIPDAAAGMADGILGVVLRFNKIQEYLEKAKD